MAVGIGLFALLHVLPATDGISSVDDTISEYAFTSLQWLFNLAVLLIAAGTGTVFVALVRAETVRALSVTSVAAGLWIAGLVLIIVFEKTNWAVGPSTTGTIHRIASIVAFVALPLAVIAGAKASLPDAPGWRILTQLLGVTSWLWFALILAAVARMMAGGPPWWRALPLGLVERGMALNEMLAVAALAIGTLSRCATRNEIRRRILVDADAKEPGGEFSSRAG